MSTGACVSGFVRAPYITWTTCRSARLASGVRLWAILLESSSLMFISMSLSSMARMAGATMALMPATGSWALRMSLGTGISMDHCSPRSATSLLMTIFMPSSR